MNEEKNEQQSRKLFTNLEQSLPLSKPENDELRDLPLAEDCTVNAVCCVGLGGILCRADTVDLRRIFDSHFTGGHKSVS